MAANAAVIIPVYKEKLNDFEKLSLNQVKKILGQKYPIIFVAPQGKIFEYFSEGNGIAYFPQQFFKNTQTYSILLMSAEFYKTFLKYDYILIYQLDAFVFSDKLEYFCSLGYDNIGAPWPWIWARKTVIDGKKIKACVGNGGFALRNVRASYDFIKDNKNFVNRYLGIGEDDFWAYVGVLEGSGFKSAPFKIANSFAVEYFPEQCVRRNGGELPFGCHGWDRCNADSYIKIFMQAGYDIRPFKNQMRSIFVISFQKFLINLAYQRLNRRIIGGQSLMRYLPRNNFKSIHVVRSPYSMLILARLLLENNSISDKIYFYDENEQDILIGNLHPEKLPHLIIKIGGGMAL